MRDLITIKKRSPQERLIIAKTLIESVLDDLPSAQPETHDKRTETHACDLISRQAAIDEITEYGSGNTIYMSVAELKRRIEHLPSAQPSPCEFCKHNDTSDDVACLRCTAERRTDEHDDIFE